MESMATTRRRNVPRRPSARNLAIYEAVKVRRKRQVDVGAQFGVSQRRVSKICQQVERWRDPAARQATPEELARHLVRQQLDEIYQRSLTQLAKSEKPLVVEWSGERNGQPWSERCIRDRPVEAKWLRMALQAAIRLAELERPAGVIEG
jgi:hypothetical protein